ncbi:glycosyltransferase [Cyanobacteria bacterium FACHB-63]|nr:glycosyltransferase [Cyanobacteria bacterium FACHB-63]
MKIGYLHIGSPQHGIVRYGRLLAAEAIQSTEVIEATVELTGVWKLDRVQLLSAAQTLNQADVVHFQYNALIWGKGRKQIAHLETFFAHCSRPLVVTLHDIFYPPSSATLAQRYRSKPQSVHLPEFAKAVLRDRFSSKVLALQKVIERSHVVFVCTQEEARRLGERIKTPKVNVIPHFVESRKIEISRSQARKILDLEAFTVITLLGFIYSGKGHQLLIEALPYLPETVKVVFAGGVSEGHEAYFQDLMALAEKEGVSDRVRVTGYLSEAELEQYLMATDLAVCPFRRTSASGSLSTWISVARLILSSNIPQAKEYNQLEPGAIHTFDSYSVEALTIALQTLLPQCHAFENSKVASLRQHLSIASVVEQHLHHYRSVIAASDLVFQLT